MFNVCDKEKQTKESISSCIAEVGIRASCAQINRRRTAGNYRSQSIRVATTIIITALLVTNNFHCLFIFPLRHPFISMIKRKRSKEKQRERECGGALRVLAAI